MVPLTLVKQPNLRTVSLPPSETTKPANSFPIGTQILIKNETFGLKQDFSYPPGVGGGGQEIIGIWEKKIRIIGI